MSTGSTGSTFPKWQLAILLSAPVAFGLGYLYWKNNQQQTDEADSTDKKKTFGELKATNKQSTISIDDSTSDTNVNSTSNTGKKLSALEQSQDYKNQGNVHFKSGKYDEAIEFYNKAIDACPIKNTIDLSTFYQNRAAAYELLKKWSSVKDDCTKALELNPRYVKALHRRARACEQLKELENCLEDITATCILESFQNKNALFLADRILKELGRIHAREAMKNRKPVLQSQHFVKSYFASFVQDPIKRLIVDGSARKGFIKAKHALDNQNYEDIIPACTEEIDSSESENGFKAEATLLRGTFYLLSGRYPQALADLDYIINSKEASPKFRANALIKRASLNMQIEKHDECFNDFNEAEKVDPDNADVYHHRGQVFVLIEKMDKALADFEQSIELAPEQPLTFVHKCYAEYRLAVINQNHIQLMQSMNNFGIAIDKYPNCVECYSLMAQVLSEQQQFEQADGFFEKAIQIDPTNATLFVHRGLLQLQWNGDVEKAVDFIQKAIDMDDKCEFAYETLGTIEVQRANLERAIELFDSALSLAKSEMEMIHIFSLKDAAIAQMNVSKKLGIDMTRLAAIASGI
jgi:import receptor subunit TOM70